MEKEKSMLDILYVYALIYIVIFICGWSYSCNEITRIHNDKKTR